MLGSQGMVFTLYGDYIRYRGGEIWTGSLIKLLLHLGMSEQAVRSVLSRMWKKWWLRRRRVGRKSYYSLTKKSEKLLAAGAQRIFEPEDGEWSGDWYLVGYNIPESHRHERNKLRRQLTWMGCGAFNTAIWISPWDVTESVLEVSRRLQIEDYVQVFRARHLGFADPKVLAARCWDLERINAQYASFVEKYEPMLERDCQSQICPQPHRPAPCGQHQDRPVQLALRQAQRRELHRPYRGYRCCPQRRGGYRHHPGCSEVAGYGLGRGA